MGQNEIGCGRILVSSSHLLLAAAQKVPGRMATACGVLVPVSIATMTSFLVSLLYVHTNISGVLPSPAEPQPYQARSRKIQREVSSAQRLIRISYQITCRTQIQSLLLTTDMWHIGLGITEGTFCYSLVGGAQGLPGTNQVFPWSCGCGWGDSSAQI